MVYHEKFVVAIVHNGKILREKEDGNIYLPFGSEYSILLKNLNTKRVIVKIDIDGKNSTSGGLILDPKESVELERFLEEDLEKGYKFKFIKKTEEVSEYRGDNIDDGIIRIEYQFEKNKPELLKRIFYSDYWPWWNDILIRPKYFYTSYDSGTTKDGYKYKKKEFVCENSYVNDNISISYNSSFSSCNYVKEMADVMQDVEKKIKEDDSEEKKEDRGITVKGSDSFQKFKNVSIGELEENSQVILIKLKGYNIDKKEIQKPVFVSDKLECKVCGLKNKSDHNFCGRCGARLII